QQEHHAQFGQHAQGRAGQDLVGMDQAQRRRADQATCDDFADDAGKLHPLRDLRPDLRRDEDEEEGQEDFGSMMHLAGSIGAGWARGTYVVLQPPARGGENDGDRCGRLGRARVAFSIPRTDATRSRWRHPRSRTARRSTMSERSRPNREAMSKVDTAWLRMERPTNRMMITGVLMLAGTLDHARVKALLAERFLAYRRFRQKAVVGVNGAHWVVDEDFDLDWHVRVA